MQRLTEKYNFEKFWKCLERQDRYCAKWDETRTDQDVFIRRTLHKWFVGKYFRLEIQSYSGYSQENIITSTKYVFICNVRFGFSRLPVIVFNYMEPHSAKMEEIRMHICDFYYLKIIEAESDFLILQKFYPTRTEPKPNPFQQVANTKNKTKKCPSSTILPK